MMRLLLLGFMGLLIAVAFQSNWVEVHWDRVLRDINLPFLAAPRQQQTFTLDGQGNIQLK
jgi:hypothetical protein